MKITRLLYRLRLSDQLGLREAVHRRALTASARHGGVPRAHRGAGDREQTRYLVGKDPFAVSTTAK